MHPPSTDRPRQRELELPLLQEIQANGNEITPDAAYDALADRLAVPDHVQQHTRIYESDERRQETNTWKRDVRFAKLRLQEQGYVYSRTRGVWALTDEGIAALGLQKRRITLSVIDSGGFLPSLISVEAHAVLPTSHQLRCGDARDLSWIPDGSVDLTVTSMPYADAVEYIDAPGQLGHIHDYEEFLAQMGEAFHEIWRVTKPSGMVAINMAEVSRERVPNRRNFHVLDLPAHVSLAMTRELDFYLTQTLHWHKRTTARGEAGGHTPTYGSVRMPRRRIALDTEYIKVFQKPPEKPGTYPSHSDLQRQLSRFDPADCEPLVAGYRPDDEQICWRTIWNDIPGETRKEGHSCPWPIEVPRRLIRMYSYVGQTVLDPFSGTGRTTRAAMRVGRNSIANELVPAYHERAVAEAQTEARRLAA